MFCTTGSTTASLDAQQQGPLHHQPMVQQSPAPRQMCCTTGSTTASLHAQQPRALRHQLMSTGSGQAGSEEVEDEDANPVSLDLGEARDSEIVVEPKKMEERETVCATLDNLEVAGAPPQSVDCTDPIVYPPPAREDGSVGAV
eukprot:gene19380-26029_t